MDSGSTSFVQRSAKVRSNRQWTIKEDAALVESLVQLCINGYWKADNGFRPGYLTQVEKLMEEKLPECGLKAVPHIESRVKTLRKQTLAITDMIHNSSGFAWDEEQKMIICEKAIFDDWVKVHVGAKGLRNKPFSHYDSLAEVFRKDRANGLGAETMADAVEDLDSSAQGPLYDNIDRIVIDELDDNDMTNTSFPEPSINQQSTGTSSGASKLPVRRKRTRNTETWASSLGDLALTFGKFVDITQEHLQATQQHREASQQNMERIGTALFNEDQHHHRTAAMEQLMNIPDLSELERLDASSIILGDSAKIDIFLLLPDNLKRTYVLRLLGRL